MGLGTKRTAATNGGQEFIVEIEGAPKNCDVTRWGRFTDIKDIKREMLKRIEAHFEKWLNP